jgi:hypothetical protein|tara:strand:- start:325 stop:573 length:249 start_codon:yes stop_codon:yes gene_type:complete
MYIARKERETMKPSDIDCHKIQVELQDLIGREGISVKTNKKLETRIKIACTDDRYIVILNPSKCRTPKSLNKALQSVKEIIT